MLFVLTYFDIFFFTLVLLSIKLILAVDVWTNALTMCRSSTSSFSQESFKWEMQLGLERAAEQAKARIVSQAKAMKRGANASSVAEQQQVKQPAIELVPEPVLGAKGGSQCRQIRCH